jgi:cell division septation protein DedD
VRIFKFIVFACIVASLLGCGGQANTNVTVTNENKPAMNANKVESTPTPAVVTESTGSLATPAEAYRTAYAIREKKDAAAMKKILSKDVIEFLSMMAEGEKKTLDEEIATMFDRPQAKTAQTRNEKINGDRATIEYLDETGNWDTMDFIKEGNDWKLRTRNRGEPQLK